LALPKWKGDGPHYSTPLNNSFAEILASAVFARGNHFSITSGIAFGMARHC